MGRAFYYHIWDLPIFILMGAAAGTLGAAFNHMHVGLVHLRAYYLPNRLKYRRLAEVRALCIAELALMSCSVPACPATSEQPF